MLLLRILFIGPALMLRFMFAVLNSRFGIPGIIFGVVVMLGFGGFCLITGIANAFHVNTVLGIVTLFPPVWAFDFLFGLIRVISGENVWQLIANLIYLAQTSGAH